MKDSKDILADALAQLKGQDIPRDPPQEVVDRTLQSLAQAKADRDLRGPQAGDTGGDGPRTTPILKLGARLTVAAAVVLLAGYAVGRLSGAASLDLERLRGTLEPALAASLEPSLRHTLVDDMRHRHELALANMYVQIREELTRQYREELNRFATQMLTASNAATNHLLAELLEAIKAEQNKELHRIATAFYELERKRLADRELLGANLVALAQQTETELERTRDDFVQLLVRYAPAPPDGKMRTTPDPNQRS